MLSTSAFNALLKTLEEPPPHVKFIFATTESRKIPVTILSRCQRFDLKRVDSEALSKHLAGICQKEDVQIDDDALALVALAAEGSVRDSLSLLDQAIARASEEGGKPHITGAMIRSMLGAADNSATFTLIETLLRGQIEVSLSELRQQYEAGADPLLMVQNALETVHLITRIKVAPAALSDPALSEQDRAQAKSLADQVSMPVITRLWQMLLKGLSEVRVAPSPIAALEMLLVRIAYAAELPTPDKAQKPETKIQNDSDAELKASITKPNLELVTSAQPQPANFAELVTLFEKNREPLKHTQLMHDARLISFAQGEVVLKLTAPFPRDFLPSLGDLVSRWTGKVWKFSASNEEGEASLADQQEARKKQSISDAQTHPLVASVLEQFPGATVTKVHSN
jgi:DNA polymerase-3 subunit gamma/tau